MNLKKYPNILLIAGNGRNVGKTFFTCRVIEKFKDRNIIAIKISPHFHSFKETDKVLVMNENYIIMEEIEHNSPKDSSKFLNSGAHKVFFLMVKDSHIEVAFKQTLHFFDNSLPIVIESAALRNYFAPGLFFHIFRNENSEPKESMKHLMQCVDQQISFQDGIFDFDFDLLSINEGAVWSTKK